MNNLFEILHNVIFSLFSTVGAHKNWKRLSEIFFPHSNLHTVGSKQSQTLGIGFKNPTPREWEGGGPMPFLLLNIFKDVL